MMSKLQKVEVWLAVIVSLLTLPPALWGFVEWLTKDVGVELALWDYVKTYYSFMYGWVFQTYKVPGWTLIIIVIGGILLASRLIILHRKVGYIKQRITAASAKQSMRKLEGSQRRNDALIVLDSFRSMTFFGANWNWEWTCFPPRAINLIPYCRVCGSQLNLRPNDKDPEHACELICNSDICNGRIVNIFSNYNMDQLLKAIHQDLVREAMQKLSNTGLV